jgi:hypothetical protein
MNAFPNPHLIGETGMTLRDYFAAQAMRGLIDMGVDMGATREDLAREAYAKADAMLKERAK